MLKKKFPCLKYGLRKDYRKNSQNTIIACFCLHNISRDLGDEEGEIKLTDEENERVYESHYPRFVPQQIFDQRIQAANELNPGDHNEIHTYIRDQLINEVFSIKPLNVYVPPMGGEAIVYP